MWGLYLGKYRYLGIDEMSTILIFLCNFSLDFFFFWAPEMISNDILVDVFVYNHQWNNLDNFCEHFFSGENPFKMQIRTSISGPIYPISISDLALIKILQCAECKRNRILISDFMRDISIKKILTSCGGGTRSIGPLYRLVIPAYSSYN